MKFRIINKKTGDDVTHDVDWVVDVYGSVWHGEEYLNGGLYDVLLAIPALATETQEEHWAKQDREGLLNCLRLMSSWIEQAEKIDKFPPESIAMARKEYKKAEQAYRDAHGMADSWPDYGEVIEWLLDGREASGAP